MPTVPQSELPKPKSWDEFEDIVWDLYKRVWGDPDAQRYGRTGQAQQGVDIYGRPARLGGRYAGIQCKRYDATKLTRAAVEKEIAKAEEFEPALAEYIVATTDRRDATLQRDVREIDEERRAADKFPVRVVFWEDLCSLLAHPENRDILQKHYGEWLGIVRRAPFTLPPDLATFTGRDDLLAQLDDLLQPGGTASVAIVGLKGMAGVGKSALAVHAAHTWHERFPDGVVWVDLRAEKDPCQALRHVAGVYGFREDAAKLGEDRQALMALFRTLLHGRRALLILDNAEGLGAEDLDCLLPGVEGPVTVVTSRKDFAALDRLGKRLRVDVMEMEEALALLGRLVGAESVERDHNDYARLAERLGRLPLALDIAGRRMADRGWGPAEMMRRLEGARDLPAFLALPVAEKAEESVALTFALSYDGLGAEDQDIFRALGPFAAAGFTAAAVAGVVRGERGEEKDGEEEAETALERLEALSLVRRAERQPEIARDTERYDLHPLVRDYARALSEQAGDKDRWAKHHARYFLALADWGCDQLGNPETALQAVGMVAVERGNLLAAQRASVQLGMWDQAVGLAHDLGELFTRSGHWTDRRRVFEAGIDAAREGGDEDTAAGLSHNLGIAFQQIGEYREAQVRYEQALEFKRQLGDRAGVAASLHQLGMLAQHQGDYPEARRLYQEALDIARQLDHRAGIARSLHQLGKLARLQGDHPEAHHLYQGALDIEHQLGDRAGVARSLHSLGTLAQDQGDYPEARRLYQESMDIAQPLGDRAGVAGTLHSLGSAAYLQGNYPEACRLYQESLDITRQLGDRASVAALLHNMGVLAQGQRDYSEARRLYQESLDIKQQLGDRAGVARSLYNLGMRAEEDGNLAEAERLFAESLGTFEALGMPNADVARRSLERVRKRTG
jgi:tetratricopeptide (TPR) repeat protein